MSEHAAGVTTERLTQILDHAQECDDLTPAEKETAIRFAKDEDAARVYTEYGSAMHRLLLHPAFDVESLRVCGPDDEHPPFGRTVSPTDYDGGAVTGIRGTIPIGYLTVATTSTTHDPRSNVVSNAVLDNDPRKEVADGE